MQAVDFADLTSTFHEFFFPTRSNLSIFKKLRKSFHFEPMTLEQFFF